MTKNQDLRSNRVWQCGIRGEVAKNVVIVVNIAIFIRAILNEIKRQAIIQNRKRHQ
jgi:hypothetical protein